MDLQEAFRRSIAQYFKGKQDKATKELTKKVKFDKKYFDSFEKAKFDTLPDEEQD